MKPALSPFVQAQVEIYKANVALFDSLRQVLTATLEEAAGNLPGVLMVQGRVKTISSFAEKCLRKRLRYAQPAWQLTDLCGVRVIVASKDGIAPMRRFIEASFEINENEDTALRLAEMEFGYQSVHYIVSLSKEKEALYRTAGSTIPGALFRRRDTNAAEASRLPIGPVFKAEIQVRTLLQHAWAVMIHDNLYKTELKFKPRDLVRESGRIAALLEDVDEAFLKLLKDVRLYESFYGAYMTPDEILDEIAVQRAILPHDPANRHIALKLARLADTLDDATLAPGVEADLSSFEHLEDADIQRELGMVRWKQGYPHGRENLLKATTLDPLNPDNWCELGRSYYQEKDYWNALKAYEEGFRTSPQNPRALLRYIECRILERADFGFIPLIRHNLEQAIETSRQQVAAGINIPWAWYDIGFFQFLLGCADNSLDAYGKAILATHSVAMVEAVYHSLTRIHQKAKGAGSTLAEHLNWIRSFFKVLLVGRFRKPAEEYLRAAEPRLDGYTSLTICTGGAHESPFSPDAAIAVIAGDCAAGSQKVVLDYGPLVRFAFDGFTGTVCSGGTRAGISGVVGDLPDPHGGIQKIAYLPSGHPAQDEEHPAYKCIRTTAGTYTPLDPIMLWSDMLASGVNPANVRLLGIGGGTLSAFEYRLALLLRAKVGVLSASGRAALEISTDPQWSKAHACSPATPGAGEPGGDRGSTGLLRLPSDPETVRAFLQPPRTSRMIAPQKRLQMAAATHESYRKMSLPALLGGRKEMAAWEHLDDTFKAANLSQIDHIEEKLKRLGLILQAVPPDLPPALFDFNEAQVETLAEMEHGRWVVERLMEGWTFGEARDNEKKTRPQLIPWADLPEVEKDKDRRAMREIPYKLADVGYQIVKPAAHQ